jgi:WD40 repeat protein
MGIRGDTLFDHALPALYRFGCCLPALMAVLLCFGLPGCTEDSPVEPVMLSLPPLSDFIPYEELGEGTLVFERIGPTGYSYQGVYVLQIGQKRSLALNGIINGPAVSPDGQKILFTTYTAMQTAYDVYIMNIDGSGRQQISSIAGQEHYPNWSFDAKQIFFLAFPFDISQGFSPLYRQSPVSNPPDKVVVVDPGKQGLPFGIDGPVSASSTGKLLCSGGDVNTLNWDGSGLNRVVARANDHETLYSAAWSPDGQDFALLSLRRDSTEIVSLAVVLYQAGGTAPDTLVSMPARGKTEWSGDNSYSLCWSPDGSQIAFTRPDGPVVGSHIFLIKRDGSGLTQVTFTDGVTDRSLSWGR